MKSSGKINLCVYILVLNLSFLTTVDGFGGHEAQKTLVKTNKAVHSCWKLSLQKRHGLSAKVFCSEWKILIVLTGEFQMLKVPVSHRLY